MHNLSPAYTADEKAIFHDAIDFSISNDNFIVSCDLCNETQTIRKHRDHIFPPNPTIASLVGSGQWQVHR